MSICNVEHCETLVCSGLKCRKHCVQIHDKNPHCHFSCCEFPAEIGLSCKAHAVQDDKICQEWGCSDLITHPSTFDIDIFKASISDVEEIFKDDLIRSTEKIIKHIKEHGSSYCQKHLPKKDKCTATVCRKESHLYWTGAHRPLHDVEDECENFELCGGSLCVASRGRTPPIARCDKHCIDRFHYHCPSYDCDMECEATDEEFFGSHCIWCLMKRSKIPHCSVCDVTRDDTLVYVKKVCDSNDYGFPGESFPIDE